MKLKLLKLLSLFSMVVASGAISGASRFGIYQGDGEDELRRFKNFKEEKEIKKLMISFTVMCSMLLSMAGVLAATVQVWDSEFFRTGYYDNAYVIVTANQDDVTFKYLGLTSNRTLTL